MGLFMDKSGIPLAFFINPGNQNEQLSLKPLEQQIMRDFELSRFVVCTDAGLSSDANRRFNNFGERSFITTQSIKKFKRSLKEWCLDCKGWQLEGSKKSLFPKLKTLLRTETRFFTNRCLLKDMMKKEVWHLTRHLLSHTLSNINCTSRLYVSAT